MLILENTEFDEFRTGFQVNGLIVSVPTKYLSLDRIILKQAVNTMMLHLCRIGLSGTVLVELGGQKNVGLPNFSCIKELKQ